MLFGIRQDGGINQATLPCILHSGRMGLMLRTVEGILKCYRVTHLKEEEQDYERMQREVSTPMREEELQKKRIFSTQVNIKVNKMARYWGKLLQHQSDRSLGRTYFPQGISSADTSKFNASEMPGVCLLFLLVLASKFGDQYMASRRRNTRHKKMGWGGMKGLMGNFRLADYIWVLEMEILKDELLRSPSMSVSFIKKKLAVFIPLYKDRFKRTINRNYGNKMNTVKVHSLDHLCPDLIENGSMACSNAEVGEVYHKDACKATSELTQGRVATIDEQSCTRLFEKGVIGRSDLEFGSRKKESPQTNDNSKSGRT